MKVFLLDDHEVVRRGLKDLINSEPDLEVVGEAVTGEVTEALIRSDGEVLYPVRDDIPIMLIDESISLPTQA